jgi:hypothetical protein
MTVGKRRRTMVEVGAFVNFVQAAGCVLHQLAQERIAAFIEMTEERGEDEAEI